MQAIRSINLSLVKNQAVRVPVEEVWKVTALGGNKLSWDFSIDISPGVSDREKKQGNGKISANFSPNAPDILANTLLGGY